MGSMSFQLPDPLTEAAAAALGEARVAGAGYQDHIPCPALVAVADGLLTITRPDDESGFLAVPWAVPGFGAPVVSSATLRERAEPYRLLVELARGKLNQVRTQLADWQAIGLSARPGFEAAVVSATRALGQALLAPTPAEA
ncbi:MAG: hypothetical protein K2V38_24025, partial [Gemmataceae bacterium]|nr:hypothetical protein [Gemmataceae bacterium]